MTTLPPRFSRAAGFLLSLLVAIGPALPAGATWSIVLVDTRTKEIAIGAATCIAGTFDLKFWLPVMVVQKGGGVSQASVDQPAPIERRIMFDGLMAGTDPADILAAMEANESPMRHQQRQYGIVDVLGRRITFTGSLTNQHASGVTGMVGDVAYAIQGNILTGSPVITNAEAEVVNTNGDLAEKLMRGMEGAYVFGGDGRCSCDPQAPESCGSPPKGGFEKSAHVAFFIISRAGDTDGVCNINNGCANGDYFLVFNIANQTAEDPDPVIQLRALFDAWRASQIGVPDAVLTTAEFTPAALPANGAASTLLITLRDWQGTAITDGSASVTVAQETGSAGVTTTGSVTNHGDGTYSAPITAGTMTGTDLFRVTVDDGMRPVILMPPPALTVVTPGDFDGDGMTTGGDIQGFVAVATGDDTDPLHQAASDVNGNSTYGDDTAAFVGSLLGV